MHAVVSWTLALRSILTYLWIFKIIIMFGMKALFCRLLRNTLSMKEWSTSLRKLRKLKVIAEPLLIVGPF